MDGTRLLESGGVRLVINQSVVPVEWSFCPKNGVVYPLLVSKVIYIFILSTLCIKYCLLILPSFVAICEI